MKRCSVLVLLMVALVGCNLLLRVSNKSSAPEPAYGPVELNSRRLKESGHAITDRKTRGLQNVRTDDYQPADPSPSSKASIRPGPIEHDSLILPYLPTYMLPPAQSPASPVT